MDALPLFVDLRGRPVALIGAGEAADAKRRLLTRAGALVVGEADARARLAIVVDDDAAVARLKARGVLVNAVDRPALCDFTLPAIVDRAPVLIAIGTAGKSAGLAKALRARIEALLPAGLGALAAALHGARAPLRERYPDAADRRRALDAALAVGGALDPLRDDVARDEARDVAAWLAAPAAAPAPARLVWIALASGDPDELTLRAARLLSQADRVYHAATVPPAILDRARADAVRIPADSAPADAGPGLSLFLEPATDRWAA